MDWEIVRKNPIKASAISRRSEVRNTAEGAVIVDIRYSKKDERKLSAIQTVRQML